MDEEQKQAFAQTLLDLQLNGNIVVLRNPDLQYTNPPVIYVDQALFVEVEKAYNKTRKGMFH